MQIDDNSGNAPEAAVSEMLRLASRAGYTMRDQEELRKAVSTWLPRFLHRAPDPAPETLAVEAALVQIVTGYTRRLRSELYGS